MDYRFLLHSVLSLPDATSCGNAHFYGRSSLNGSRRDKTCFSSFRQNCRCAIVCGGLVIGPCFVLQYFVSFLVLQLSLWEWASWPGCFTNKCVLNAMSLYSVLNLLRGVIGWSVVCECIISWSYSPTFWYIAFWLHRLTRVFTNHLQVQKV